MKVAKRCFEGVWDAIEDSPSEAEAMKVRAQLLRSLRTQVKLTFRQAA